MTALPFKKSISSAMTLLLLSTTAFSNSASAYTHAGGMHSEAQIQSSIRNVEGQIGTWVDARNALITLADSYANEQSNAVANFNVPGYYQDTAGHQAASSSLQQDVNAAYTNAVAYRLTGNHVYADKAKAFLNDWAFNNHDISGFDGTLVMTYAGVGFIHTAELLRNYGGWGGKAQFAVWLQNVYLGKAANLIKTNNNNWGDWGNYGAISAYYYLDDTAGVNNEITRLRDKIDVSIASDGSMPHETARGTYGIWYTYFSLAPMTAAAHVAKEATGTNLFNWTSPSGKTLKSALDYLLYYVQNPSQWPHFNNPSILPSANDKWPNNLFEAMSNYYNDPAYAAYAAQKRPLMVIGHHYAWAMPTLMKGGLTLHNQNFNSMTAGQAPQRWTISNSANASATVVNTPSTTNKSLRITDTNAAGAAFAVLNFPVQQGIVEVEWKQMHNSLFPYAKMGVKSSGTYATEMFTTSAGLVYRNAAGTDVLVQLLSPNTWYTVKLVLNPQADTADIYVNGQPKATNAPFRTSVSTFNNVEFAGGWGSTGTIFIDDVKVSN